MKKEMASVIAVGLILMGSVMSWAKEEVKSFPGSHKAIWQLEGSQPYLIGGYGDNFSYSGENVKSLTGEASVLVDAEQNIGIITVVVNGTIHPEKDKVYSGQIKLVYQVLPTDGPLFWEGGVADFVYIHGDTGQGPPVMPKLRTFLASWAPVDVYVDGKLVYEALDGHMMYTERSRDPRTQAIYADASRTSYYSPMEPGKGYVVAPDEKELHFVAHSTVKDPDNFPPHTVWIHLNFEEVKETSSGSGGGCF